MPFELIDVGSSRSVPEGDALRALARADTDVTMIIGGDAVEVARALARTDTAGRRAVLVELGIECLGFHTDESGAGAPVNILGFARFQFGSMAATPVIELVRLRHTANAAISAASALFKAAGLEVCICNDAPGRIVDRLIRPYLNAALESVDEGLAAPEALDEALRLGLGYPLGPIEMLQQGGLEAHHAVTAALHDALGLPELVPARQARNAALRKSAQL